MPSFATRTVQRRETPYSNHVPYARSAHTLPREHRNTPWVQEHLAPHFPSKFVFAWAVLTGFCLYVIVAL